MRQVGERARLACVRVKNSQAHRGQILPSLRGYYNAQILFTRERARRETLARIITERSTPPPLSLSLALFFSFLFSFPFTGFDSAPPVEAIFGQSRECRVPSALPAEPQLSIIPRTALYISFGNSHSNPYLAGTARFDEARCIVVARSGAAAAEQRCALVHARTHARTHADCAVTRAFISVDGNVTPAARSGAVNPSLPFKSRRRTASSHRVEIWEWWKRGSGGSRGAYRVQ